MTTTTILNQLGGNKFIAMTGAVCFQYDNTLVVKFRGSKVANIMHVTLNADDTYKVEISKFRGVELKPIKTVDGVYAEMLKGIFEQTTGLKTSL